MIVTQSTNIVFKLLTVSKSVCAIFTYISFGDPYKRHQIPKINILLIIMLIQYLVENQNTITVMNITHVLVQNRMLLLMHIMLRKALARMFWNLLVV